MCVYVCARKNAHAHSTHIHTNVRHNTGPKNNRTEPVGIKLDRWKPSEKQTKIKNNGNIY